MEQRHITGVMFSAVVHQSSTATVTAIVREIKSRMKTRATRRRGGQARALPGDGWGRPGRERPRVTNAQLYKSKTNDVERKRGPPIP
jgi:hypothetical protein